MSSMKRLRGLRALVGDAVEHGSKAVEVVHKATAARTFDVLEAIPPIATPAKVVHVVHDASLTGIYGIIRAVNRVVGVTLDLAIDVAEEQRSESSREEEGARGVRGAGLSRPQDAVSRPAEVIPGAATPLAADPKNTIGG